jgi:hypothetical protein
LPSLLCIPRKPGCLNGVSVVTLSIISALGCCAGKELWERLQWSFGDKQATGFTYQGTTKKYPVLIGELTAALLPNIGTNLLLQLR